MSDTIQEQENTLFEQWRAQTDEVILQDGVFDEAVYQSAKPKILFVLKEPWMDEVPAHQNLLDTVRKGDVSPTWTNLTRWAKILRLASRGKSLDWTGNFEDIGENDRREEMKNFAMMDLKKTCGGTTSNMDDIEKWVVTGHNKEFLRQQFEIYQPDFVVCCGTRVCDILRDEILEVKGKWLRTSRGLYYFKVPSDGGKSVPVLDFFHPQQRSMRSSLLTFSLYDAWKYLAKGEY